MQRCTWAAVEDMPLVLGPAYDITPAPLETELYREHKRGDVNNSKTQKQRGEDVECQSGINEQKG